RNSPSPSRFRPQNRSTFRLCPCWLPRTAYRFRFDLLPRRARRNGESRGCKGRVQEVEIENVRILRILNNQHFHSGPCNLWKSRSVTRRPPEAADGGRA